MTDPPKRRSVLPTRSTILLLAAWCLSFFTGNTQAQAYQNWAPFVRHLDESQLRTPQLRQVAHTVMSFQTPVGGWPKNIFYPTPTAQDFEHLAAVRQKGNEAMNLEATIDNGATTVEIRFLLQMARANRQEESLTDSLRTAALHGIEYLLCMQYSNGGFPQYWPRRDHYHACITFNDNAMTNALRLLMDFAAARSPFEVLEADSSHRTTVKLMRQRARKACIRGVRCMLDCQLRDSTGSPAIWCQQHDPVTLAAVGARAFELPSFCTSESIDILRFLRQCLEEPLLQDNTLFTADELTNAVRYAERWLDTHALTGIRKVFYHNAHNQRDFRMAPCLPNEDCPRLWARFYDLHTERPIFVDRDGIPRSRIEEIGWERRNGYAWFNTDFDRYKANYPTSK